MNHITYVPKACTNYMQTEMIDGKEVEKEVKATFSGQVILKTPSYEDRLELASNPDFMEFLNQENRDKKKKETDENIINPHQMKTMVALVKWSYQYYEKVDLVRLKDNRPIRELDMLRYDSSCGPILQEIATKLSSGFELGNS